MVTIDISKDNRQRLKHKQEGTDTYDDTLGELLDLADEIDQRAYKSETRPEALRRLAGGEYDDSDNPFLSDENGPE